MKPTGTQCWAVQGWPLGAPGGERASEKSNRRVGVVRVGGLTMVRVLGAGAQVHKRREGGAFRWGTRRASAEEEEEEADGGSGLDGPSDRPSDRRTKEFDESAEEEEEEDDDPRRRTASTLCARRGVQTGHSRQESSHFARSSWGRQQQEEEEEEEENRGWDLDGELESGRETMMRRL
ncbi:hypothetical protein Mp_1g23100 [Marchantia polymorpha subsp. ruderalis]|uniref:Uncharacterized protein n=2 Tax=Marchantia polymorpha TaxID=3197 RepID=A0AAF6ATC6_MARPO|nr:hypothetical protein MARPO_0065s0066 [Marchantia polymorpha]BBM99696.1 hypothetical protein Mp_1g23100 [Marchantia polymorpha subsp. ruderalis]|eukprot:PTQ36260.1 hypothetical protein MARPO_0065s0066 [Marchantia polymorpha]